GGTGFVFHDLNAGSLADTVGWAVSTWYDRPAHIDAMRRRAMRDDHSWDRAAREYVGLYLSAYARRRGHEFPGAAPDERPAERAPGVARARPATAERARRAPDGRARARGRPKRRLARRSRRG